MTRVEYFRQLQDEQFATFQKKNRDYGDSFANDGLVGVLVRMGDKISRAKKITTTGIHLVKDESLRDTLEDLSTYCLLAMILMDEASQRNNADIINLLPISAFEGGSE